MIQDDQEVFSDIIKVLDATNDTNCARALSNIVELVGRLARSHWLRKGKGDLWHATNSIWLDLRRQLDLEVHKTDPGFSSTSDYFKGKERADLRDLAFLAEVATYGAAPASQRARTELKRFLSTSRSESSPAYRAIELFNQLLGYESRPTPVREERSEKEVLSKWEMHAKEIHEETSGIDVP